MYNKNEDTTSLLNEIIKGIEDMKGEDINKIDLRKIENSPCEYFVLCSGNSNTQVSSFVNSVNISAEHHLMISELKKKIVEKMESNFQTVELQIPYKDGKIIADAQQGVKVLERNFEDHIVRLKIRGAKPRIKQIINSVN